MREDIELTSFTKGELSPRLKGRTDYKGYFDGLDTQLNMVALPQGGSTRRPGTLYGCLSKDQATVIRLIPFRFSLTQCFMLEFGNNYVRVLQNGQNVTNNMVVTGAADNGFGEIRLTIAAGTTGLYNANTVTIAGVGGVPNATGTWLIHNLGATTIDLFGSTFAGAYTAGGTAVAIVEIPSVYTAATLNQISYAQSNDVLFLAHPAVFPSRLVRASSTNWGFLSQFFLDGPYLPIPASNNITPSATTGPVTLTLGNTNGINGDTGWSILDVGRHVRIGVPWGWAIITGIVNTLVVNANIEGAVSNGAAAAVPAGTTGTFQIGKWSETTGYPWIVQFFQNRLFYIGTNVEPNAIEGSQPGDFFNFAPTKSDGTVIDANALSWIMQDQETNATRWVSQVGAAQTPQLGIGTEGSEHVLQAGSASVALTPTSVQVYRESTYGGKPYALALRIGKSVLFPSFNGRKLYEWKYDWQASGYLGAEKSVESEHLTRGKIKDLVFQKDPYGIVWMMMEDGSLIGMTYLPEQQITAWHQHKLGGDYYGGQPIVESIGCIPEPAGTYSQLYLLVKRTINGSVVRTIEVMARYFDAGNQEDAVYMDLSIQSALVSPSATITPSAASGNGITWTATAGTPFVIGDVGKIIRANGGVGQITGFTSTTVVTGIWYRPALSKAPVTSGSWTMTAQASTFTGLSTLEGQTVQLLGDGADMGTAVVSGGSITVPTERGKASFMTAGLPFLYRMVTMPWATQQNPSSIGKVKTGATLWIRFLESLGCDFGRKVTDEYTTAVAYAVETLTTRSAGDVVGFAPPLFTGLRRAPLPGSHDLEGQIVIQGQGPYPTTVLSLVAIGDVGEMPGPG